MSDMPVTEEKSKKPRQEITILVNNRPVVLHQKRVTGEKIKHAAGVPANFKLFDPAGREIGDEEHIEISEGERFTAISGQDVS